MIISIFIDEYMRSFDYSKYKKYSWDNEILNYLTLIHEFKGKQELYQLSIANIFSEWYVRCNKCSR